ncbi:cytochrome d ubiquinol oxidase subunit II [Aquirhabdus parva]|uniref:Cytochrome d ubiquinol oxidase subunit II n=1 Tax=Aquirhabdus parva TaxID=2283318 RepID=A0A345P7R8_9GAMM|nr:cytochrome d ubiquinol oxidase subunit II [Aquirhabdus parva]AXI03327.1 cytochrome d ubiquinol oxidase subunit II [Aquirhabdus parva]
MSWAQIIPLIFMGLLGFALFVYVVLDGFDLGVGMLMHRANTEERNTMVASIGPFWDANETWLVLGIGILLIAFPKANSIILGNLYIPVAFMLIGLIMRGVAFDFRVKARLEHQLGWNYVFIIGSGLASATQGWMLGRYVTGFAEGWQFTLFALAIALAVPATYTLLGACWLLLKTEGELQAKATRWAKIAWVPVVLGMILISLATPWVSTVVRDRWFALPQIIGLLPIPLATGAALIALRWILNSPRVRADLCWLPFVLLIGSLVMGALGLAYSLYPYAVIGQMTVWDAASSTEALNVILIGAAVAIPAIFGYTIFAFWVFRGKVRELTYG